MSLPPILQNNSNLLNSIRMPTSSTARSKNSANQKATTKLATSRSNTFADLPSSSSSAKGGPSPSPNSQKPSFLSDRQMSVLGITQTAPHKRTRAKSRLATVPKKSASNTDLSSNFSSLLAAPNKPKLSRVNSENKLGDLNSRHRNFSDSNLPAGAALSKSFNRQLARASKTPRPTAQPQASAAGESDSDDEKEDRIVAWLLGVEDADAVTDQVVVEEAPRQTDTAIHVVYQGD